MTSTGYSRYYGEGFCRICTLVLLIGLTEFVSGLRLEMPSDYELGSKSPLVLDCVYETNEVDSNSFDLKWYFNENLIYQWLYPSDPSFHSSWKSVIDFNFTNGSDNKKKFRAFHISKPAVNLSGEYKCLLDVYKLNISFEQSVSRNLIIYVPVQKMILDSKVDNSSKTMEVECTATGMMPQPKIYMDTDNDKVDEENRSVNPIISTSKDKFEITTVWSVNLSQVNTSTTFNCTVFIPNTRYQRSKTYTYEVNRTNADAEKEITISPDLSGFAGAGGNDAGNEIKMNTSLFIVLLSINWIARLVVSN